MEIEGIETVCMDMDCRLHTVHNAVPVGMDVGTDAEDFMAHSDCDIVVGRVSDQCGEKDLHLRDGLGLSNNAKGDDGVRRKMTWRSGWKGTPVASVVQATPPTVAEWELRPSIQIGAPRGQISTALMRVREPHTWPPREVMPWMSMAPEPGLVRARPMTRERILRCSSAWKREQKHLRRE